MEDLLAVQAVDIQIDQGRHQTAHHPLRTAIQDLSAQLRAAEAALAEITAERDALRREEKRLEDEAQTVATKAEHISGQLYGGGKSIRELEALEADLASLKRRQNELEDHAIELMEQLEPVEERWSAQDGVRQSIVDQRADAEAQLTVALAELEAHVDSLLAQRAAAAVGIDAARLTRYETLRGQLRGAAVARLVGASCEGCHLILPAAEVAAIRALPADAEANCPECGCILVRGAG